MFKDYGLARRAIFEMGLDNGTRFEAGNEQIEQLDDAMKRMQAAGVTWDDESIEMLAAGEHTEMVDRLGSFDGFEDASRILNEIFDGPDDDQEHG